MKKALLLFLSCICFLTEESFASTRYISIGTGAITGVYYPAGGAVCRLVNRGRKEHGIRCSVESTGGSVSNLNAIRNGAIDFGIVQSDWQYHAYNGSGFFSDQKPFKDLRSVLSLYTETFSIAVLEKSGIEKLDDILGKKVNFGPQGSGVHATMEVLTGVKGWTKQNFSAVTYLQPSEQPRALCEGKIDAMIYVSGNPNGVLQEATQTCKVKIIPIDRSTIDKLIEKNPFYVKATIPGGVYAGNPNDVESFGVKAAIVTSEKQSSEVVYNMVKVVMENFDNFKTLHPVFSNIKKDEMLREGNSAPSHPGSERYFREAKLLKK
ncbi:MAG: TAXI family TRAP transporter solute-binding subunit [Proteobacteria bacterium]|nr:TAXI family TRAP transporter solute-binding subunit [Pseudomonadota bacterium]